MNKLDFLSFLGLYINSKVIIRRRSLKNGVRVGLTTHSLNVYVKELDEFVVYLKPLETVTVEDAQELINIYYNRTNNETVASVDVKYPNETYAKIIINLESGKIFDKELLPCWLDYLRFKGYAVPYMGNSVNNLVDLGLVELSFDLKYSQW